jgi:hypothetical protein
MTLTLLRKMLSNSTSTMLKSTPTANKLPHLPTLESHEAIPLDKDPYYVQHFLGHKKLETTEIYINIEHALFEVGANNEFTVRVTEKPEEIKALLEVGFQYGLQKDNLIFLRKRK